MTEYNSNKVNKKSVEITDELGINPYLGLDDNDQILYSNNWINYSLIDTETEKSTPLNSLKSNGENIYIPVDFNQNKITFLVSTNSLIEKSLIYNITDNTVIEKLGNLGLPHNPESFTLLSNYSNGQIAFTDTDSEGNTTFGIYDFNTEQRENIDIVINASANNQFWNIQTEKQQFGFVGLINLTPKYLIWTIFGAENDQLNGLFIYDRSTQKSSKLSTKYPISMEGMSSYGSVERSFIAKDNLVIFSGKTSDANTETYSDLEIIQASINQ